MTLTASRRGNRRAINHCANLLNPPGTYAPRRTVPSGARATASGVIARGPFRPATSFVKPGVLVAPAQHATTSTPEGPSSAASASASARLNAFVAPYVARYAVPQNAVRDDNRMIVPLPRFAICAPKIRAADSGPRVLSASIHSCFLCDVLRNGPFKVSDAFHT